MVCGILLVDDNEAYTDNIKDILEDENYLVKTANSGEAACEMTRQKHFDLVLMDIKMPGMNGVETFLKMKQENPDVKVVLFTAYALTELIEEAHSNGVLAVLKKPLDWGRLDEILSKNLKKPSGGYILVADDDRALCENLNEVLTDYGYHVAMACTASDAITEAENQRFDVLLLDLKMPQINGLEIYRRIKKLQPRLVTIIMTGYAEEMAHIVNQALDESAYTMMPKPIDVQQLLQLLHHVSQNPNPGATKKTF